MPDYLRVILTTVTTNTFVDQRSDDGLVVAENELLRNLPHKFLDGGHLKRLLDVRVPHEPENVYDLPQTFVLAHLQCFDDSFPGVSLHKCGVGDRVPACLVDSLLIYGVQITASENHTNELTFAYCVCCLVESSNMAPKYLVVPHHDISSSNRRRFLFWLIFFWLHLDINSAVLNSEG